MNDDIKRSNEHIYRYLINGGSPERPEPLRCAFTGVDLDDHAAYELHHIRVFNGVGVNRSEAKPGHIMGEIDLRDAANARYLVDIMGTVPVERAEHERLHANMRDGSADIDDLTAKQLPWILRHRDNFTAFCRQMGLALDFDDFLRAQRNSSVDKGLHARLATATAVLQNETASPPRSKLMLVAGVAAAVIVVAAAAYLNEWGTSRQAANSLERDSAHSPGECPSTRPIKGNINARGKRYYHRPQDPFYARTTIDLSRGERCFATEAEATSAGWVRPDTGAVKAPP